MMCSDRIVYAVTAYCMQLRCLHEHERKMDTVCGYLIQYAKTAYDMQ